MDWFKTIENDRAVACIARAAEQGKHVDAVGTVGSSSVFVAAAVARRTGRMVLYVTGHLDEVDEAADELTSIGVRAQRFSALEVLPGETGISLDLLSDRLQVVRDLDEGAFPEVLVTSIQALMQAVPPPTQLGKIMLMLRPGDETGPEGIVQWLADAGYERVAAIESPGEFAVRGGVLDVFPPGENRFPVRLDFFGDELETIREIDPETMGSDRRINEAEIIGASLEKLRSLRDQVSLVSLLPGKKSNHPVIAVLAEVLEITEQGRGYYERVTDARGIFGPPAVFSDLQKRCLGFVEINRQATGASGDERVDLPVSSLPHFPEEAGKAVEELGEISRDTAVIVACQNEGELARLTELVDAHPPAGTITREVRYVHRGFRWGDGLHGDEHDHGGAKSFALVPYHELLHRYQTRRRFRKVRSDRAMDDFLDIEPGDIVVHRHHGIARFVELTTIAPEKAGFHRRDGEPEEYLTLEFAGRVKLHVPATKIDLVQKYIGGFHGKPQLSTLGGKKWKHQKAAVQEAVRDLASEMLRVQAAREHVPGIAFPDDTDWQRDFEAEFPFEETEDQLAAVIEAKKDMAASRPMDRLLCGDVGYGKTEVAIRAAFKAAEFGKQVAVLVPTTVLAEQHERTFRSRMSGYPFRIESLSRFKTAKQQQGILEELAAGRVDIIIGTHRLLSRDVRFADLGLVIVDEEQRFGVEHKQHLLSLRMTVDVLTMSATPIPRTLHMSMLGLRDISSLSTAPLDRRAVVTEVIPYNGRRIKAAIERELAREGQVYFVHNRVHNIQSMADEIQKLVPEARIAVGHGQMSSRELERVMLRFMRRQADILVCTTIIESGIDIPTANTMFINRADMFGLADLHQLRGRVGRYKHRAYCYLLLPPDRSVQEKAMKRLKAIEEFSMLGAGFKIAMRDLELRGAGNLLGPEQSGHIAAVGYEMYCQLLEQEVKRLRNEPTVRVVDTNIDIGVTAVLPRAYIPSDKRRMQAYRRFSQAETVEKLRKVEQDLTDAYGELPRRSQALVELAELRIYATALGVRSITIRDRDVVLRTRTPGPVVELLREAKGRVSVLTSETDRNMKEVYYRPPANYLDEPRTVLRVLRARLKDAPTPTNPPTPTNHPY
ncbi:MAG TPA: transcription-repair coupling factor [Phycisphaeraceae bacterium]|nr:transcription-repair coupling factor [Phycisphaeraceae bacterium]